MAGKRKREDVNVPILERPMTPSQLANYLQISLGTLRRIAPAIPSIRVGGQTRFLASDVIEALKKKGGTL